MTQLTKAELIRTTNGKVDGVNQSQTAEVTDALLSTISDALVSGRDVLLDGVGKLTLSYRGPRTGRNPQTGEEVQVSPSVSVNLRANRGLKRQLRDNVDTIAKAMGVAG